MDLCRWQRRKLSGSFQFLKSLENLHVGYRFDDGEDELLVVQGACGSSSYCGLSSAQLVQWKEHTFWPVQATCVGFSDQQLMDCDHQVGL
jgi:hypothetical protein